MSTFCAIAVAHRHPRGEPHSLSPPASLLVVELPRGLAPSLLASPRRPIPSAAPFSPRSPFVAQGDVGDLGGLGDLDVSPAPPRIPASFLRRTAVRLSPLLSRQTTAATRLATLQLHIPQQLPPSVAKNEFRDTSLPTTPFPLRPPQPMSQKPTEPMAAENTWQAWHPWPTRPTRQNQPFFTPTAAGAVIPRRPEESPGPFGVPQSDWFRPDSSRPHSSPRRPLPITSNRSPITFPPAALVPPPAGR